MRKVKEITPAGWSVLFMSMIMTAGQLFVELDAWTRLMEPPVAGKLLIAVMGVGIAFFNGSDSSIVE